MTDIATYVAERRALLRNGTPAPWHVEGGRAVWAEDDHLADLRNEVNATTIVALRNDEERQLAVIEAAGKVRAADRALAEAIRDGADGQWSREQLYEEIDSLNAALDALLTGGSDER